MSTRKKWKKKSKNNWELRQQLLQQKDDTKKIPIPDTVILLQIYYYSLTYYIIDLQIKKKEWTYQLRSVDVALFFPFPLHIISNLSGGKHLSIISQIQCIEYTNQDNDRRKWIQCSPISNIHTASALNRWMKIGRLRF